MPTYVTGRDGELYHWKYVKREKQGDHWKYWYPEDLKKAASDAANAAKNAAKAGIDKVRSITPEDIERKKQEATAAARKAWGYDAKANLDRAETDVKNAKRHEQTVRNDWAKANSEHRKVQNEVEIDRQRRGEIRKHFHADKPDGSSVYYVPKKDKNGKKHTERVALPSNRKLLEQDAERLRPTREKEGTARSKLRDFENKTKATEARRDEAQKAYDRTPMAIAERSKSAAKRGAESISKSASKKLSEIRAAAGKFREDRHLKNVVRRETEQDKMDKRIKRAKKLQEIQDYWRSGSDRVEIKPGMTQRDVENEFARRQAARNRKKK